MVTKLNIKTLKTNDVAWLLGTDIMTVKRWAKSGIIKSCRTTNEGEPVFKPKDIAKFLAHIGA